MNALLAFSGSQRTGKTQALLEVTREQKTVGGSARRSLFVCLARGEVSRVRPRAIEMDLDITIVGANQLTTAIVSAANSTDVVLLQPKEAEHEFARILDDPATVGSPRARQLRDFARAHGISPVLRMVSALSRSWLGPNEIEAHASAAALFDSSFRDESQQRWHELSQLAERWQAAQRSKKRFTPAGMAVEAGTLLRDDARRDRVRSFIDWLVIDDYERADFALHRVVVSLIDPAGRPLAAAIAGNPDGPTFRRASEPNWFPVIAASTQCDRRELRPDAVEDPTNAAGAPRSSRTQTRIRCSHPSLQADVAVSALVQARGRGVPWNELAIVTPNTNSASLDRSARRLGVPLARRSVRAGSDPLVVAFARLLAIPKAALRQGTTTDTTERDVHLAIEHACSDFGMNAAEARAALSAEGSLHSIAFALWTRVFARIALQIGPHCTASARAYLDALARPGATAESGLNAMVRGTSDAVEVLRPDELHGTTFSTIVLVDCVDAVWPGRTRRGHFIEEALLDGPEQLEPGTRHVHHLEELRKRFEAMCVRATDEVIAIAAPSPGMLVSRYVEDWTERHATFHRPTHSSARTVGSLLGKPTTASDVPCHPGGGLKLSASQLETFENCPLAYALQYVAGARSTTTTASGIGTVVHEILERFLRDGIDPNGRIDRSSPALSLDRLLDVMEECWDSTLFDYRPQEADYRRRVDGWLRIWHENELPTLRRVIGLEHRFTVPVGPHELRGSIDRVSIDTSGVLEIVDYKTGSVPAGSTDPDDLQLATYFLASQRDEALAAFGRPGRLRLHYLQESKDIDQPVRSDHEATTEERIVARAEEILRETYEPSIDADCEYCACKRVCPLQPEGRQIVGTT